ncbi:phosphatidylinositol-specific phospholipase C1-like protein [Xanthomonas sp. CFBP 8703]|uniref:Phosphatidylinositol-specific phospholipase C1-like protein n=1 Tax=Xanthomonas bonasiae TaxID=2810351 RepID=A0ABS3B0V0_9XANT|nr:phosphatidylinositol-specific phospholipase C1-like protein [Xanthomonas bonasiae]
MHLRSSAHPTPDRARRFAAHGALAKRIERIKRALLGLLALAPLALHAAPRLNELQYIGSHNSYHAGFAPSEAELWKRTDPAVFATLDYRHPPLTQQFDDGVRQIELDIYADAKGGRYAHPAIVGQIAKAGLPPAPAIAAPGVMETPGFKVMHVQDLDQRSTCQPLVACLQQVRAWSTQHPGHLPVFVLLETEESSLQLAFPTVQPEPFDAAAMDALDAEIRSVFRPDEYLSPDQVRGTAPTLNAAILAHGWPSLSEARGKIVFLLDQHSVGRHYLPGHPSLRGRVCFTNAIPGEADAAFTERNDGSAEEIARLVKAGYLVRTRTDADLKEPARGDTTRRDSMLASGAQLLSTDYPDHEPAASGYVLRFAGDAAARCNPQFPAAHCAGYDLTH